MEKVAYKQALHPRKNVSKATKQNQNIFVLKRKDVPGVSFQAKAVKTVLSLQILKNY